MEPISTVLLLIAALCALIYLPVAGASRGLVAGAIKTLSVAGLALAALQMGLPGLLVAALAASAVGDFCLAREGEGWFLAGMVAFGAAHATYVALFLGHGGLPALPFPVQWLAAVLLAGGAVAFLRWLRPHTGRFAIPVAVYATLILAMALTALWLPEGRIAALIGALLFVASDMMLAAERFHPALAHHLAARFIPYAVWSSYWLAQALILSAWARPFPFAAG